MVRTGTSQGASFVENRDVFITLTARSAINQTPRDYTHAHAHAHARVYWLLNHQYGPDACKRSGCSNCCAANPLLLP